MCACVCVRVYACVCVRRRSDKTGWARRKVPMGFFFLFFFLPLEQTNAASWATLDSPAGKNKSGCCFSFGLKVWFLSHVHSVSCLVSFSFFYIKNYVCLLNYFDFMNSTADCNSSVIVSEWNYVISVNLEGLDVRRGFLCFVQIDKLYACVYILSYRFILIKRTCHKPLHRPVVVQLNIIESPDNPVVLIGLILLDL